ncbi:unnamed protein product [Amoebophrya sp. A120]|nr:unnamed protein product [Amoebophrya sp. A120]|eukprot:GSA120T00006685001.1
MHLALTCRLCAGRVETQDRRGVVEGGAEASSCDTSVACRDEGTGSTKASKRTKRKQKVFRSFGDLHFHCVQCHWSTDYHDQHNAEADSSPSHETLACRSSGGRGSSSGAAGLYFLRDTISPASSPSGIAAAEDWHFLQKLVRQHQRSIVYEDEHLGIVWKPRNVETMRFKHDECLLFLGRSHLQKRSKKLGESVRDRKRQRKQDRRRGKRTNISENEEGDVTGPRRQAESAGVAGQGVEMPLGGQHDDDPSCASEDEKGASDQLNGNICWEFSPEDFDPMSSPEPVHRLDKDTGGLLLFAKTKASSRALCRILREHRVQKRYRAILRGHVQLPNHEHSTTEHGGAGERRDVDAAHSREDSSQRARSVFVSTSHSSSETGASVGIKLVQLEQMLFANLSAVDSDEKDQMRRSSLLPPTFHVTQPIDGRNSCTEVQVLKYLTDRVLGKLTVVDFFPRTGRMHQLRKHAKFLQCPILGDRLYSADVQEAKEKVFPTTGLCLFALGLRFEHPFGNGVNSVGQLSPNLLPSPQVQQPGEKGALSVSILSAPASSGRLTPSHEESLRSMESSDLHMVDKNDTEKGCSALLPVSTEHLQVVDVQVRSLAEQRVNY